MERKKIVIIFHHIGPYHHARLSSASRTIDLTAVEWCGKGSYEWGGAPDSCSYKKVTVFQRAPRRKSAVPMLHSRLTDILFKIRPRVVAINGWNDYGAVVAMRICIRMKIPFVVMSDSTYNDFARYWWVEMIKRRVVRLSSAAFVAGSPHRSYVERLGLNPELVFLGYDVVDNAYFFRSALGMRQKGERLGLPSKNYFLASSRFVQKKNLMRLLDAFSIYRLEAGEEAWDLVLLGDGELRLELESHIANLGLSRCVHLPGFRQYPELPKYYAFAGAFIHASTTEQWGLVVNEAMASGLPVLVSERCGCCPDLVENGRNGFAFDPYDVEALGDLMRKIAGDDCDRAAMGKASLEIINRWSPETFSAGLEKAIEAALKAPLKRVGILDRSLLAMLAYR